MASKTLEPEFAALQSLYQALKPLDEEERRRVLSSLFALLGISEAVTGSRFSVASGGAGAQHARSTGALPSSTSRPLSLIELVQQKNPTTNAQRIALFAYYREREEDQPRFARSDLERYFALAKVPPAGNYTRDFVETVKKGWIHEDGADSYLTSKGVEAVESGFPGERKYSTPAGGGARKRTAAGRKRRAAGKKWTKKTRKR